MSVVGVDNTGKYAYLGLTFTIGPGTHGGQRITTLIMEEITNDMFFIHLRLLLGNMK